MNNLFKTRFQEFLFFNAEDADYFWGCLIVDPKACIDGIANDRLYPKDSKQGLLSYIVLEIKIKHVRFIAGLAEMNKTPYFTGFSHFGATGRHGGVLHFFSPPQYHAVDGLVSSFMILF